MGDEEHGQSHPRLHLLEEHQVLELDGHVEGGGGLVGDEQPRLAGQRDGADHALLHPSAHLVREGQQALLGRGHPHPPEGVGGEGPQPSRAVGDPEAKGLDELVADREDGVQRRLGILEDHGDPPATHLAHLALALRDEVLPFQQDLALDDPAGRLGQEAEEREGGHRLARSRLAHDAEGLAGADGEAHPVDGADEAPARLEVGVEVLDLEHDGASGLGHRRRGSDRRGCRAALRPAAAADRASRGASRRTD
jgi:hypothetical protein